MSTAGDQGVLAWMRRHAGTLLIVGAGAIAFFGALRLGWYFDDFANIQTYRERAFLSVARDLHFNRFPLFALALYPWMLHWPTALAHALVIAAHIGVALLLRAVLKDFGFSDRVSVIAALLFLLAPAHTEVLHWVDASTVVFGVGLLLFSARELGRGRFLAAALIAFAGMLFSEAIILPAAALHGLVLLHRRERWWRIAAQISFLACLYGAFLIVRRFGSAAGSLAQYKTGLANVQVNARDLLMMALGRTSRDINWFWDHSPAWTDVSFGLPQVYVVAAVVCALAAIYGISRLDGTRLRARAVALGTLGCFAGLLSAIAVFLVVTGNLMQPRYTYVPLLFVTPLVALLLGGLDRGRVPRAAGALIVCALLTWSFYRAWSTIWRNWLPATRVADRILADAEASVLESGISQIYVVNAPRVVGNAYVFTQYWAYQGAGAYLKPRPVQLLDYPPSFNLETLAAGARFSSAPCRFLGWREGQRFVGTRAFVPQRNLVLDCGDGLVHALAEGERPPELSYDDNSSQAYRELSRATPPAPPVSAR